MSNTVTHFREFTYPKDRLAPASAFNPGKGRDNESFAISDLEKSGLDPLDVNAVYTTDLILKDNADAGYVIPYTNPDGTWITRPNSNELAMYRMRLRYPEGWYSGGKYTQPPREELIGFGCTPNPPYIPPAYHTERKTNVLVICEGEKKTACVSKYLHLSAIGIGGCWNWRLDGDVHPWILEAAAAHNSILIVPDGDVRRYDIARAYGSFLSELRHAVGDQISVHLLEPADKIDDLIMQWRADGEDVREQFKAIPRLESLVEDPVSLAARYDLSCKFRGDDRPPLVEQHNHNLIQLMLKYPGIDKFWFNEDSVSVWVQRGDETFPLDYAQHPMDLTTFFQHNLGFNQVRPAMVKECIESVARKDRRSPWRDWLNGLHWDGEERLSTWLINQYGLEDTPYGREMGRKFLVASVARIIDPGVKVDWMAVMAGPQGVGKTYLAEILWGEGARVINGVLSDKDLQIALASNLCIVLDEMHSFTKRDQAKWKSILSETKDTFRRPYGVGEETHPRRAIFYGTTNIMGFLPEDASGYRRYMPLYFTEKADFQWLTANRDQLFAEAVHLYREGLDYWRVNGDRSAEMHRAVVEDLFTSQVWDVLHGMCQPDSRYAIKSPKGVVQRYEFRTIDVANAMEGVSARSQIASRELHQAIQECQAVKIANAKVPGSNSRVRGWRLPLSGPQIGQLPAD